MSKEENHSKLEFNIGGIYANGKCFILHSKVILTQRKKKKEKT